MNKFCVSEKQCCSMTSNNTRCINEVIGKSKHCESHRASAKKLYDIYKKFCSKANEFNIENSIDIQYLTKAYIWLNRAFDARMNHRKYSFVPECYDAGHDFQFVSLKQKIDLCETKLAELYKQSSVIADDDLHTDSSDSLDNSDNSDEFKNIISFNVPKKIQSYRQKRKQMELEIDICIERYINENKALEARKTILANYIKKCMLTLVKNNSESMTVFIGAIYHIMCELYSMDYFDGGFSPEPCECGQCSTFASYRVNLFCKCGRCMPEEYLVKMSETNLKKVYEILLLHKSKIQPVVNSLLYYYHFYGKNISLLEYSFSWDPKINSLVVEQESEETPQPTISKMFSYSRLKDKYYMQKMQREMELMDSDDSDDDSDSDD